MPPNSCHDFNLLLGQIDLEQEQQQEQEVLSTKEYFKPLCYYDSNNNNYSESQETNNNVMLHRHQMEEEIEKYWDFPANVEEDYCYRGMTTAARRREEVEAIKANNALEVLKNRIEQQSKEDLQNSLFLVKGIETHLIRDFQRRKEENEMRMDPNACYWDF